jgi:competence protein ComGC
MQFFDFIWSIFVIFLLVAWIWVIIGVISDVFRSSDLGGLAKGLWVLFIIVVPWLGVLAYLIIRGKGMQERGEQAMLNAKEAQRHYIQSIAGTSTSIAEELSKLAELKDNGVITETEFLAQKAKLLG